MDNVTHTLIGITLGKLVTAKSDSAARKKAILWTAVLASNAPDLDFVAQFAFRGRAAHFSYLMHHRGWTHTLLLSPVLALMMAWLGAAIARIKMDRWIFGIAWLAVLLHVAADYCNDYGVHPFSPVSEKWLYGDFMFILEPALWLAMIPLAMGKSIRGGAFWFWGLIGLGLLGFAWGGPYLPPLVAAGLTVWAIVVACCQLRWRQARVAALAAACVLLAFFVGGAEARSTVSRLLHQSPVPGETDLQLSTSPAPGNPLCWKVIHSMRLQGDYVVEAGVLSLAPRWFDPRDCHYRNHDPFSMEAPVSAALRESTDHMRWIYEFRGSFAEMDGIRRDYPAFDVFLRFARFPFWKFSPDGTRVIFGDLRYDRGPGLGFAKYEFSKGDIPQAIPPWEGVMYGVR